MIHFLQFFYAGKPWYAGAVWGNAFVVPILAVGGWLWSRTRFWPLRPLERLHHRLAERLDAHEDLHAGHTERLDAIAEHLEQLHSKLDKVAANQPVRRKRTGS